MTRKEFIQEPDNVNIDKLKMDQISRRPFLPTNSCNNQTACYRTPEHVRWTTRTYDSVVDHFPNPLLDNRLSTYPLVRNF